MLFRVSPALICLQGGQTRPTNGNSLRVNANLDVHFFCQEESSSTRKHNQAIHAQYDSSVLNKTFTILAAYQAAMPKYTLQINGAQQIVETEPDTPLLYVLRDYLALNGPKFGCGLSQCGACAVLVNDSVSTSCMLPVSSIGAAEIKTLEGLASDDGKLHVVQEAFVKEQATQCGYCLNGMVMAAVSLLNKNPNPDDAAIRIALQGNLCRCGAHTRIMRAVRTAAKNL